MKEVTIIQDEQEPVAVEIIAKSIVRISDAVAKMFSSGLNYEAVITLLHADCGVGKPAIRQVLRSLADLRKTYCA